MKASPTDIDREAARVFQPAPGMRGILDYRAFGGMWVRVKTVTPSLVSGWYDAFPGEWHANAPEFSRFAAFDTDDPATVGCMLAQVRVAHPSRSVSVVDRRHTLPGEDDRRFQVLVHHGGTHTTAAGPTCGAALVAAMRALKGETAP